MRGGRIWAATTGVPGAPHVVLIHGSLDRSAGMLKLSRRLDRRFRVTRYDRRGYGRSAPHPGPFAIADQVADLVEVLDAAPDAPGPHLLLGHSYGGNVALATAQRRPDRVAGVVVYETPLPWLEWWPNSTAGSNATAWDDDPADAAERFMRRLVGDARWERLPPATREARRSEGPALVGELRELRKGAPWSAELVSVPVIAMRGEHGPDHHRRSTHTLAELFASEVVTIPGARHFGPNTHPELVAAVVERFAEVCFTPAPDA
jgi:pimeloyl-ACP methyl ester carboxylesterase